MNREEKLKVLAGLDGLQQSQYLIQCERGAVKRYLTSYDAIIPLIQKQPHDVRIEMEDLLMSRYWCAVVQHTAEELSDALIKAVGKWRD